MTKIEELELELKCLGMAHSGGVFWGDVIREAKTKIPFSCTDKYLGDYEKADLEIALGIVEGKSVWEGDELFPLPDCNNSFVMNNGQRRLFAWESTYSRAVGGPAIMMRDGGIFSVNSLSWNPPKPKTVMVELTIEQAELGSKLGLTTDIASACRKALEKMK